jgi:hypothetical protein
MANANRPQIAPNVYSGNAGETSSFYVSPGGAPIKFASGAIPDRGANMASLASNAMHDTNVMKAEILSKLLPLDLDYQKDPTKIPPKIQMLLNQADDWGRQRINALEQLMGRPGGTSNPAAPTTGGTKLTDEQYITSFMAKNPGQNRAMATQYLQSAKQKHPELFQ